MSARDAIEPLQQAYFFDARESDDKIEFVKRGAAASETVPEADLAAHEYGQQHPSILTIIRQQELDLPQSIAVQYVNIDADYQGILIINDHLKPGSYWLTIAMILHNDYISHKEQSPY